MWRMWIVSPDRMNQGMSLLLLSQQLNNSSSSSDWIRKAMS